MIIKSKLLKNLQISDADNDALSDLIDAIKSVPQPSSIRFVE